MGSSVKEDLKLSKFQEDELKGKLIDLEEQLEASEKLMEDLVEENDKEKKGMESKIEKANNELKTFKDETERFKHSETNLHNELKELKALHKTVLEAKYQSWKVLLTKLLNSRLVLSLRS